MLFTQTEPIIEASQNITFTCFQGQAYSELLGHMKAAKLSPWNNKWSEVFDFSPDSSGKEHFTVNNAFLTDEFTPRFQALKAAFDNIN